jgi:hypothetical protein
LKIHLRNLAAEKSYYFSQQLIVLLIHCRI